MMIGPPRRIVPIAVLFALLLVVLLVFHRTPDVHERLKQAMGKLPHSVAQQVGLGEQWEMNFGSTEGGMNATTKALLMTPTKDTNFVYGTTKGAGYNYSMALVVPRMMKEDISWMDTEIPDIEKYIYIADDPTAPLHPPENKGHEVMIYLTFIIDHYDNLPDVTLFMHAHRRTWHNNDVLGGDAGEMVRRLNPAHVTREGYMNLRCQWYPGCPDWMHPGNTEWDQFKTEQVLIADAWSEIFPFDPIPNVLAQPCCSQFALSKARIRSHPKERFIRYRNWLLKTPLKDFISGRVWEYMWQFAFTGESFWCPQEHKCYCDGYGVCFGGSQPYDAWFKLRRERDDYNNQLLKWEEKAKKIQEALDEGRLDEAEQLEKPEEGLDRVLRSQINALQQEMDKRFREAVRRGDDPRLRAEECDRDWNEGDGF